MTPDAIKAIAALTHAVETLTGKLGSTQSVPFAFGFVSAMVVAAFTAWLTARYELAKERRTWEKEAKYKAMEESLQRVRDLIAWAHRGAVRPYPYLQFMYLQLYLRTVGAGDLCAYLARIRCKVSKLDADRVRDRVTLDSLDTCVRDIIGDLVHFGVELHSFVAEVLRMQTRPCSRSDIDA
jgi:hypothetical protein